MRKRAAFSDSALGSTYQGLASHKRTYLRQPVRCGPAASNRVSDVVRENNVSEQPCSIRHHQRRMRCTHRTHYTTTIYLRDTTFVRFERLLDERKDSPGVVFADEYAPAVGQ